jgi:hypothetical protein
MFILHNESACKKECPGEEAGALAFSKAAETSSNVSVFVKVFAVFGLGFVLYGAYQHFSK